MFTNPDILQEDPSPPLVLQFHELLCMLPLLVRLTTEELGKVVQCQIISVKVICLRGGERGHIIISCCKSS